MELLLNLLWLSVGVTSFVLLGWRLCRSEGVSTRFASCQNVITLTCALVILFPVISLTDDLHDEQIFLEDSSPLRSMSRIEPAGSPGSQHARSDLWLASVVPVGDRSVAHVLVGYVEEFAVSFANPHDFRPSVGRAPPVFPS